MDMIVPDRGNKEWRFVGSEHSNNLKELRLKGSLLFEEKFNTLDDWNMGNNVWLKEFQPFSHEAQNPHFFISNNWQNTRSSGYGSEGCLHLVFSTVLSSTP